MNSGRDDEGKKQNYWVKHLGRLKNRLGRAGAPLRAAIVECRLHSGPARMDRWLEGGMRAELGGQARWVPERGWARTERKGTQEYGDRKNDRVLLQVTTQHAVFVARERRGDLNKRVQSGGAGRGTSGDSAWGVTEGSGWMDIHTGLETGFPRSWDGCRVLLV